MRGRRLRRQDLIAKQGKKPAYVNIFVSSATFPGFIAFIIDEVKLPCLRHGPWGSPWGGFIFLYFSSNLCFYIYVFILKAIYDLNKYKFSTAIQ